MPSLLWNLMLHIGAGVFGCKLFTFEYRGILFSAVVAAVVQFISSLQMHFFIKKNKPESITNKDNPYYYKMIQWYLMKVILYGMVTLCSAYITRKLF